ncbi:MAG: hypothetical protein LBI48_02040 [Burkholderiaceae bacterium]|jgi:hypothetical protein|nr:hypothetical protein [Burkholderiaceae bacterium]
MEVQEKPADQLSQSTPESARKAAEWIRIADDLKREAAKIIEESPEAERRFAARKKASQSPPAPPVTPVDLGGDVDDNGDMDARIIALETVAKTLATKEDVVRAEGALRENLALTKGALREDIARVEGDLRKEITRVEGALRTEIAGVETRISKAINDQTWKVIGWVTTICTLLVAAVYFIAKHAGG